MSASIVFSILLNTPHMFITDIGPMNNCVYFEGDAAWIKPYSFIYYFVATIAPSLTIFILNVAIIRSFIKSNKIKNNIAQKQKTEQERELTRRLITISCTHVILTSPCYIMAIFSKFTYIYADPVQLAKFALIYQIAKTLYFLNNSVNGLLYCLTGKGFRKDLRNTLYRQKSTNLERNVVI